MLNSLCQLHLCMPFHSFTTSLSSDSCMKSARRLGYLVLKYGYYVYSNTVVKSFQQHVGPVYIAM